MIKEKEHNIDAQPILFYDGDCGLCNFAVRFILSYEKKPDMRFARLQSDLAARLLPPKWISSLDTLVLMKNGRLYAKSNAVLKISTYLKFPLCCLSIFKWIPRPLLDCLYDWVAKNRKRFFNSYCSLVDEDTYTRFVD